MEIPLRYMIYPLKIKLKKFPHLLTKDLEVAWTLQFPEWKVARSWRRQPNHKSVQHRRLELIKTFQPEEGWCGGCGTRVAFSSDNKNLYAASHNGPVRKYDLNSFKLIKTYEEKTDDLTGFAISSDGKTLARSTEKETSSGMN